MKNQSINMKSQPVNNRLLVTVQDDHNNEILQFQVPFSTEMKLINKLLWDNKQQFESNKNKIIGFQNIAQDALIDFNLHRNVGNVKNNLSLKPLYKNTKLQGLSRYKLLKCLATGGFSKVYLVRSMINGEFYAAKFVDKLKVPSEDKKILILNQKKVNEVSDYPFLVKMHQFIETQHFYIFIMDYCPGGELFFLLRSIKRMTEEQARIYFVEILLGIQYLHKQGIMYRDLKPENIMIDETGHVKIADFGLAKFYRDKSFSFCGSIQYMSPEIVTNAGHSFEVDYYCLGALLFQLLIGCPPFYDPQLSEYETKKNIAYTEVQFPQDFGLTNQVKDLIQKLLIKSPNQRLGHFGGAKQIMLHPWIGKINRNFVESRQFQVPFPPDLQKFNFDPDEVGMSEARFTSKIQNQYKLLKPKQSKQIPNKEKHECFQFRKKSMSPYTKKYSQSQKKTSQNRKSSQGSLTHLLSQKNVTLSYSNFKSATPQQISKFSNKKRLSKEKCPSFSSLEKDKKENLKNIQASNLYLPHKFYNMKTEANQTHNSYSISANKLIKKKKQLTESSEIIKDVSNQYMKNKGMLKNKMNNFSEQMTQKQGKQGSTLLKKSCKLKMKKFTNQNNEKNPFKYGKNFRQTCII